MKKYLIFFVLILFISCSKNKWDNTTIAILPMGLDSNRYYLIDEMKSSIEENPDFKVIILKEVDLPKSAWYQPRKRYKADKILKHLKAIKPDSVDYILAFTSADISVNKNGNKDWGIFGLGFEPGKASVVSTFRLGKNKRQLNRRVLKITKHELGHNFGLHHCKNSKTCVMNSAEGSIKTVDRVSNIFCKKCKEKLRK
ncbi:MAG: Zn-dependent protease [Bacteroidia bacterium]